MCTVIWDTQRDLFTTTGWYQAYWQSLKWSFTDLLLLCHFFGKLLLWPLWPSCSPHFHRMIWKLLSQLPVTHYLEEVALDCPASPKQGSKDIPVICPTHQFILRRSQHTPPAISLLFPALSKTTTASWSLSHFQNDKACHIFSYQPNTHRVDCFPDPRDSGDQRQIAMKWLRYDMSYIL